MAAPKKPPRRGWTDPTTMRGAIGAGLLGSLAFWAITTIAQHLTLGWH